MTSTPANRHNSSSPRPTSAHFAALAILGLPIFIAALLFGRTAFDLAFHRRPPTT